MRVGIGGVLGRVVVYHTKLAWVCWFLMSYVLTVIGDPIKQNYDKDMRQIRSEV